MRRVLSICLMVAATAGMHLLRAQDLQVVVLPGSDEDLKFPQVVSKDHPAAAARINAYLQLTYLQGLAIPGEKDPFRRIRYHENGDGPGYVDGISYVTASVGRTVGLGLHESTMTSNLTDHIDWLLFDSAYGQPIHAEDVFTAAGKKTVATRIASLRKAMLQQKMKAEQLEERGTEVDDMISLQKDSLATGTTWDNLEHLELKPGQVTFHGSLGLPFAVRAYDVELDITLPMNEVEPYLSTYGRAVLGTQSPPISLPDTWTIRIFQGHIGTSSCVLVVDRSLPMVGRPIDGTYAYLKHGTAISLWGHQKGDQFSFREETENGGSTGTLAFKQVGPGLQGTWTSPDGKHSLPFSASAEWRVMPLIRIHRRRWRFRPSWAA